MMLIKDERFGEERALYHVKDALVRNCRFEGEEDGESAMKESSELDVSRCFFDLRYPFWHVTDVKISESEMTQNCRAALWYGKNIKIDSCKMNGIKALRECKDIKISDTQIVSPEFGWKCSGISIDDTSVTSEYAFLQGRDIFADNLDFHGKYSFQYAENVKISFSALDTKDAFWHSKNVTVTDSVIKGEYLGWYSEGLTLVRCKIIGTQPLCYCKKLRLIDCTMEGADLAFEYSNVRAKICGNIESVKNPRSGRIKADSIGEIILSDSVYPTRAKIVTGKK